MSAHTNPDDPLPIEVRLFGGPIVLIECVFRPKWKVQNGRSGRSVSEEVEGLLRGCGTAIPAHVARPELRRRSTLDN